MKANKKGFTLIELLAVIVILAIIALITVPVVINIINNAKKGAAEDSTYGVVEAAKLFWTSNQMNFESTNSTIVFKCKSSACTVTTTGDLSGKSLEISGTKPNKDASPEGTITITDGKVTVSGLKFGDYTCEVGASEKANCTKN